MSGRSMPVRAYERALVILVLGMGIPAAMAITAARHLIVACNYIWLEWQDEWKAAGELWRDYSGCISIVTRRALRRSLRRARPALIEFALGVPAIVAFIAAVHWLASRP